MKYFDEMEKQGHEQLVFCHDKSSGLKAIINIHDTTMGPALGGCRMWNYATEAEAVYDGLRLSRGMTYKSAASGDSYGGGKAIIWGDPKEDKSEELFRAFGQFVESLNGRFITGTDVGTVANDFAISKVETDYLVALPESYGGSGDSSILTALGVWQGMKACAQEVWGTNSLSGKTVAVQGVGKVGHHLVDHLYDEGANVIIADVNESYIERIITKYPQTRAVAPEEIYGVDCDIFSPNALGAVINDETLPRLRCKIIAGAANNVLAEERHGDELHQLGILYAPDYVINAGGLIQVADELHGFDPNRARRKVANIYNSLLRIFEVARRDSIPTYRAADVMAEERIAAVGRLSRIYCSWE
ncbi:MAG: Glu/Leu/Phe/Val dehydrogenase dimerization domain-containing protein [Bacillota bacterium]